MSNQNTDVAIIGGGLAGLTCARRLDQMGIACLVLEATDRVGGRVRTDVVDGFQLDHGFQVLLTAYPACRHWLDYEALRLRPFPTGAKVRIDDGFAPLADPWRAPSRLLSTALAPVGTLGDKIRIGRLRSRVRRGTLEQLYRDPAMTSQQWLQEFGFSAKMIDDFFRSFFGGVFLEQPLHTSSRMLEFVFRMFSSGDIAVPADGMGAIPRQLAEGLPRGTVQLQRAVETIDGRTVRLTDGSTVDAKQLVVATESGAAARLISGIDQRRAAALDRPWQATVCHYFAGPRPSEPRDSGTKQPALDGFLTLRGNDSEGPINHVAVLSEVAPEYAPADRSLISVTLRQPDCNDVIGQQTQSNGAEPAGLDPVRKQLRSWFGSGVDRWEFLRSYVLPFALPRQDVADLDPVVRSVQPLGPAGPVVCGDHRETSSLQGAMNSGVRAAEVIAGRLGVRPRGLDD